MNKKIEINHLSVTLAAIAAFVVSAIWYMIFAKILTELRSIDPASASNQDMSIWIMLGEFLRTLILTYVLAYFVSVLEINTWKHALVLCVIMWIGFPVILLSGSVIHENVHWKLAAIHAGDWFVKPLTIMLILSLRNRKKIN